MTTPDTKAPEMVEDVLTEDEARAIGAVSSGVWLELESPIKCYVPGKGFYVGQLGWLIAPEIMAERARLASLSQTEG